MIASDFLIAFECRFWDISPMETIDHFANELVELRQDIQAALARAQEDRTLEQHALATSPALAEQLLNGIDQPDSPPAAPAWMTDPHAAQTTYR